MNSQINNTPPLIGIVVLLLIFHAPAYNKARIYKHCELAQELLRLGVSSAEVPVWLCIARYESKYNTAAIGRLNGNWSNDWGIFQVSDRYWCVSTPQRHSQNLCQIDCHALLADLQKALQCAQIVRKKQGWKAWAVYNGICARHQIKDIVTECEL